MKTKWNVFSVMLACAIFVMISCVDDENLGSGEVEFEITDAPADDENVKGVFVTVTDVKVDGKSISGFSKQTINLTAYQKGNTKFLGNGTLAAKAYGGVTLVLDLDTDANGNSPGCYVLSQDNMKYKLTNTTTTSGKLEMAIAKTWEVRNNAKSNVVLDFDVRKSLTYSDNAQLPYRFTSNSNLQTAVRATDKSLTGTIKGSYSEQTSSDADLVIVYAYKKGTYTAAEAQASTEDAIQFKNAVTSALVETSLAGNTYTLAFLEKGEYELHFASYTRNSTTGRYMFKSVLLAETSVNGSVADVINVQAGANINVGVLIKGSM